MGEIEMNTLGTVVDRLEIKELKTLIVDCNDKDLVKKLLDLVLRLAKVPENEKDEEGGHANYYFLAEPLKVLT